MFIVVILLFVGICMTAATGFVQVRKLGASLRQVGRSVRVPTEGVSPFQAVCTALAATVGTGNIAGVAGAIALGGPGAVFWMWVSAFLGMATKYAEVVLAMRHGSPMGYMEKGFGRKWPAMAFCFFAVLVSFGMGNMAQVHTIASAVRTALPQYEVSLAVGILAACLVSLVSFGGAKRVGQVMEYLVPVAALLYIVGGMTVVCAHWRRLPEVLALIVREAFSPRAAIGGGVGAAVRWGVTRGVFSNEAGLGSAPLAHAAANARPEEQGLLGIFEVFLDTIVLCTLTALTILVSGVEVPYGQAAGAELAVSALETVIGPSAAAMTAICLSLLALATLMSWQLYGSRCAAYLFGRSGARIYRLIFPAVIVLGAVMDLTAVWRLSESFNALMALPNLAALLALRKELGEPSRCFAVSNRANNPPVSLEADSPL